MVENDVVVLGDSLELERVLLYAYPIEHVDAQISLVNRTPL
jgi:hypothetical protein